MGCQRQAWLQGGHSLVCRAGSGILLTGYDFDSGVYTHPNIYIEISEGGSLGVSHVLLDAMNRTCDTVCRLIQPFLTGVVACLYIVTDMVA